jgi:hypothetical protein
MAATPAPEYVRVAPENDACFQCIWATLHYLRRHVDELDVRPRVECTTSSERRTYCDTCIVSHAACEKVCLHWYIVGCLIKG